MPASIVISSLYISQKNALLSRFNDNSFLKSAIKKLERKAETFDIPTDLHNIGIVDFKEETHLDSPEFVGLGLICLMNPKTGEIAPGYFYFTQIRGKTDQPDPELKKVLNSLQKELGWFVHR